MGADDDTARAESAFGDFSIEGLDDPLAPRARPEYVELSDPDQPPIPELPMTYGRWYGGAPWSGLHTATRGRRWAVTIGAILVGFVVLVLVATAVTALVRALA